MTTLADLYDEVSEVAPGSPQTTTENRIFEVFRFFCSQSESNQQAVDLSIVSGTQDYTVTPPTGFVILNVISVLDGNGDKYTDWSWDKNSMEFSLDSEPSITATYSLTCSLVPLKGADQTAVDVPENIDNRYREGIIFGAQAKLLLMVTQPWSNPQLGATYYRFFSNTINSAKITALTRRGKRAPRTKDWS